MGHDILVEHEKCVLTQDLRSELSETMIETARSVGAAAKFTGSGGAVVTFCPRGPQQLAEFLATDSEIVDSVYSLDVLSVGEPRPAALSGADPIVAGPSPRRYGQCHVWPPSPGPTSLLAVAAGSAVVGGSRRLRGRSQAATFGGRALFRLKGRIAIILKMAICVPLSGHSLWPVWYLPDEIIVPLLA
ncbi:putative glucuronokinase 2 [Platanthera guangdongensis]|uniref:Glucuronokinase 2 n=1 Tax=Platanthera guangdongensis TaxID=2320717 RepID=A0ABR2LTI2_9ASPA